MLTPAELLARDPAAGAVSLHRRDPRGRRRPHRGALHASAPTRDFYRGHFPGNPITPGVLLIESMAQAGVVALGIYLLGPRDRRPRRPASARRVFTDAERRVQRASCGPATASRSRARKVFFRRRKLRADVEMRLEDGTLVCSGDALRAWG